nr:MgtC/SapB family protein [Sphingobium nicotianae]
MPQSLIGLVAALAVGLLIGLERGWAQRERESGHRVAGFRTFGIISLTGGVAALMPDLLAAMIALGVVGVLLIGFAAKIREDRLSGTTTIAGLLTFALGLAAVRLSPVVALAAAGGAFALLSARHSMHALLRGLTEAEIEAVARFALVALVVLPLLPNADMGPYGAWNPRRIWMVVVMVTAFSFAGYVAARKFGSNRGILVMALTGAIVSSTAVTADYARRLRAEPALRGVLTAGIALASIVMFVRVQLLTFLLAPRALPSLALSLAPALIVAALLALVAWRRQQSAQDGPAVTLGNPFDFRPALLLAALVALFSLIARWALDTYGGQGVAVVLGLTGMMDVDAAVLTLSGMPEVALDSRTAGLVLAVPVLANTGVKAVMAMAIARGRNGLIAAFPLLVSLAAALAGLAAYRLL